MVSYTKMKNRNRNAFYYEKNDKEGNDCKCKGQYTTNMLYTNKQYYLLS